jgi:small GTP-binding protein
MYHQSTILLKMSRKLLHSLYFDNADRMSINIAIVGEVSTGKSTLLNLLLGSKLNNTKRARATCSVNIFRESEDIYMDAADILKVNTEQDGKIDAAAADFELREYSFVVQKRGFIPREPDAPIDYNIIDFPGMNDGAIDNKIKEYFSSVSLMLDVIIFVSDSTSSMTKKSERDLFEYVCNTTDTLRIMVVQTKMDDPDDEESIEVCDAARAYITSFINTIVVDATSATIPIVRFSAEIGYLLRAHGALDDKDTMKLATLLFGSKWYLSIGADKKGITNENRDRIHAYITEYLYMEKKTASSSQKTNYSEYYMSSNCDTFVDKLVELIGSVAEIYSDKLKSVCYQEVCETVADIESALHMVALAPMSSAAERDSLACNIIKAYSTIIIQPPVILVDVVSFFIKFKEAILKMVIPSTIDIHVLFSNIFGNLVAFLDNIVRLFGYQTADWKTVIIDAAVLSDDPYVGGHMRNIVYYMLASRVLLTNSSENNITAQDAQVEVMLRPHVRALMSDELFVKVAFDDIIKYTNFNHELIAVFIERANIPLINKMLETALIEWVLVNCGCRTYASDHISQLLLSHSALMCGDNKLKYVIRASTTNCDDMQIMRQMLDDYDTDTSRAERANCVAMMANIVAYLRL